MKLMHVFAPTFVSSSSLLLLYVCCFLLCFGSKDHYQATSLSFHPSGLYLAVATNHPDCTCALVQCVLCVVCHCLFEFVLRVLCVLHFLHAWHAFGLSLTAVRIFETKGWSCFSVAATSQHTAPLAAVGALLLASGHNTVTLLLYAPAQMITPPLLLFPLHLPFLGLVCLIRLHTAILEPGLLRVARLAW